MPFEIVDAVIGVIVGILSCYVGWKGITVWLNETPVESSGIFNFIKKSEMTEAVNIALTVICGIAVISGLLLILVSVFGGKVVIGMPLGAMVFLIGWRLCQKHPSGNLEALGIIAIIGGGFLLVWTILQIIFRALFWKLLFGF